MSWETIKLLLFILGLLITFYEIYEYRKLKKKVPYRSLLFVVLFSALILGNVF